MNDRSTHMAVIGAGPVGLAVARALLQHSIPYQQMEADEVAATDQWAGQWAVGRLQETQRVNFSE